MTSPHRAIEADALRSQCLACDAGLVLSQPGSVREAAPLLEAGLVMRCCVPLSARFCSTSLILLPKKTGGGVPVGRVVADVLFQFRGGYLGCPNLRSKLS